MNATAAVRRDRLGALIERGSPYWRPQPYVCVNPPWCEALPQLVAELLALDDAQTARLAADDAARYELLRRHLPEFDEIAALSELPVASGVPLRDLGAHFDWAIPGRKRAQIEAFCAAVGRPLAGVVDWCAGKGHLGRLIAAQWGVDVVGLERDTALIDDSDRLARRARQGTQCAEAVDVLAGDAPVSRLAGRHVVALHACGDLHRNLVREAIAASAAAIDFAPCCYDRLSAASLESAAGAVPALSFGRVDLKLAVTGTTTAAPRETALREQESRWKLAFMTLMADGHELTYRPLRAVPTAWLREDFRSFCRQLAEREDLLLPSLADFAKAEAAGETRWRRAERLNLLRFGWRRAIEVWLVLDLAAALENAGYTVRVATFCDAVLTPRNLLVSGRR